MPKPLTRGTGSGCPAVGGRGGDGAVIGAGEEAACMITHTLLALPRAFAPVALAKGIQGLRALAPNLGAYCGGPTRATRFEVAADCGHACEAQGGIHGARVCVAEMRKFLIASLGFRSYDDVVVRGRRCAAADVVVARLGPDHGGIGRRKVAKHSFGGGWIQKLVTRACMYTRTVLVKRNPFKPVRMHSDRNILLTRRTSRLSN